jgi:hypothetical protein
MLKLTDILPDALIVSVNVNVAVFPVGPAGMVAEVLSQVVEAELGGLANAVAVIVMGWLPVFVTVKVSVAVSVMP